MQAGSRVAVDPIPESDVGSESRKLKLLPNGEVDSATVVGKQAHASGEFDEEQRTDVWNLVGITSFKQSIKLAQKIQTLELRNASTA